MQDESLPGDSTECNIVETQTVLMETSIDHTEQDRLLRAISTMTPPHTYIARRSTTLLKSTDQHYMERLFSYLLTFGTGGFSTSRSAKYSNRAIVLHYLNLSTNRFAEDPLFELAMFEYLATSRVRSGAFLRVGQDPSVATTIMRVSPGQLKIAMQNRVDQRRAWKAGRSFVPCLESNSATTALKSINASTSKMWGSNEERESKARKVDAMTIKFGAPSIFWTLTPNPDHSITCAYWTSQPLRGDRPPTLSQCSMLNMPCASDMSRIIMANTVVQAEYYKICCHLLIDILFGWDSNVNKPKSQRGIFGFVEALVYALEQQGRLFIHHHGVAWIAGLPKTQSDWDTIRASDELKSRFGRYCASIFAAELPVCNAIQEVSCPLVMCDGSLVPIPIHKKYKHLLKSNVEPPKVASCSKCACSFTESDVVSNVIEAQWNTLCDEHKAVSTSRAIDGIRHRFGGLSSDLATANVQLSRLLLLDQVHLHTHTRSCIKGRSGTKCRYNFFRKLVERTGLDNSDEIQYQRRIGNQWLNTYIPTWRRIMHFNMDARVLWSGQSLQASRYAIQYTVKRQTVVGNVAVVEMAFKKRIEREATLNTTEYVEGVGRLISLAYSTSGVMEMDGPLATAILLTGEAVTFSCRFERLVLVEGLNVLDNVPVEASIVSRNETLYIETSIAKYLERPNCLEHVCWYEFCSWFHRDVSASASKNRFCTYIANDTAALSAHVKKHGLRRHEFP